MSNPRVGIVMGSDSDWPVMEAAAEALKEFDVAHEADVVSAHRMPDEMLAYGREAADRGLAVIIAGAGGAAHLPGMLASVTPLPVIGVPVPLEHLDGMDSLLSIVQMPSGVPVATVAVGNARNAGLLAVRILAASDADLRQRMLDFQADLRRTAQEKGKKVRSSTGRKLGFSTRPRRDDPGPPGYDGDMSSSFSEDQLQPDDTLDERGVDDVLDEGMSPPERPSREMARGTTAREDAEGETLEERLEQEEPDPI
jgi:5-(carboxyamino)imidazole ribonucleotide mutase